MADHIMEMAGLLKILLNWVPQDNIEVSINQFLLIRVIYNNIIFNVFIGSFYPPPGLPCIPAYPRETTETPASKPDPGGTGSRVSSNLGETSSTLLNIYQVLISNFVKKKFNLKNI